MCYFSTITKIHVGFWGLTQTTMLTCIESAVLLWVSYLTQKSDTEILFSPCFFTLILMMDHHIRDLHIKIDQTIMLIYYFFKI